MNVETLNNSLEKAPIDLSAIVKKLWKHRKLYYIILPTVLILSYLITCCVPRYYQCTVTLAPEQSGASSASSSLGSLASSFGLGNLSKLGNNDAIYSDIYPDLFKSNDFVVRLMPVMVETKDATINCNYYTYLRDKQSSAWWSKAINGIKALFVTAPKDSYNGKSEINTFNLTKLQNDLFNAAKNNIQCSVDKKTSVITITVEDQDPLVAATMAKATCQKLQDFIIAYRTNKARIDFEYYKKLCREAKSDYERIRQVYGSYADANTDVILTSFKSKEDDLENDMQLKYNVYSSMSTQMQMAQAKLQEATPAFTVLQSASVPFKPAGPKRVIISVAMMIFSFVVLSVCILFKEHHKCN